MERVGSFSIDSFPPVVQLLIRDMAKGRYVSIEDFHKRIRSLLPDLRRQAESSVTEAMRDGERRPPAGGPFVINLSGDLDPLSATHKCVYPQCRINAAKQISRFIGLYADVAYIPDSVTIALAFIERWTASNSRYLLGQLSLLIELSPLISSGILKFSLPVIPTCASCKTELDNRIMAACASVVSKHGDAISITKQRSALVLDARDFDQTGIVYQHKLSAASRRRISGGVSATSVGKEAYQKVLADHVHETLLSTRATLPHGAITLTGSRANSLAMRALESSLPQVGEVQSWEASRAASLPWVSELSLQQILALRDQAARALPRLRARMATAFADENSNRDDQIRTVVANLREEAEEVEQELRALHLDRGENFRNIAGTLAVTISVYGFGAEFAPAGVALAGLMSALGLIHASARKDHQDRDKLQSRPGFVLLQARQILGHAAHTA